MSGDHNMYQKDRSYLDFECPRCGHCCQAKGEDQEPLYWSVADGWVYADDTSEEPVKLSNKFVGTSKEVNWTPVYTAPPKREWVGLTDEEIIEIAATPAAIQGSYVYSFAKAVEQALKDKNNE